MPCIYRIRNIVTDDCYIGKTKKLAEERYQKHIYNCRSGSETFLYNAMRKYGEENFIIETIEEVDHEYLNEREKYHIQEQKPRYNMTEGGDGGYTSNSPKFIKSMKEYHSKKDKSSYATYGMKGKKQSEHFFNSIRQKNSCPVICENIEYPSVGAAQKAYPGISIRKRLDNPKYPDFYRLRPKTNRK